MGFLKDIFTSNVGSSIDQLKYNFDQGARGNRFDVQFFLPQPFGKKTAAYTTSETKSVRRKNPDGSPVEATQTSTSGYSEHGGKETETMWVTGVKTHDQITTVTDHPAKWDASQMGLRVESCTLPGRSIDTTTFSEYGAERTIPTGTVDDGGTIDFSFICDQSFADRLIIEAWQSMIYAGSGSNGSAEMPKLSWYDDYIGQVKIIQHRTDRKDTEDTKRNALEYTLHEAYPVEFDDQTLSMDESGIMKFKCTFAYRYWQSKYIPAPERSFLNKGRVLLDSLLQGSNLLSRFGKEGKVRKALTNLDTRTTEINNLIGG